MNHTDRCAAAAALLCGLLLASNLSTERAQAAPPADSASADAVESTAEGSPSKQADPDSTNSLEDPFASPLWRRLDRGRPIPDEGYCDQPYVVLTREGHWLCTLTTGPGREGDPGQHVVATISRDHGRTWSELIDIEPSTGPEASWVVPLVVPSGRIYAFYTYNADRVESLPGSSKRARTDTVGHYVYKYSDDGGRTWSKQRYRLPMRVTACDRGNNWQGDVFSVWGICKPQICGDRVFMAFTKLGRYMLKEGEGWLWRSDNILREPNVEELQWQLLPEGEHGIRAERFGSVQEEHNLVCLSDGSLYCVYRTTTGYPCHSYSRDGGRTWSEPERMSYHPHGRAIKNPRACPKLWKTENGKYLFWFHNHSSKSYQGRNPAWVAGGVEHDGHIHWSQPEILLYSPDANMRMSYPDLIEQDGRYWVTETQKTIARVHEIDPSLLKDLWAQRRVSRMAERGLILRRLGTDQCRGEVPLPEPLRLDRPAGLSLDFWIRLDDLSPDQIVLDTRDSSGRGLAVTTTEDETLRLALSDGEHSASWEADARRFQAGRWHHVAVMVDPDPRIIMFVVDGVLCDGGVEREYGWGRYKETLEKVSGRGRLRLGPKLKGQLDRVHVYARCLRVSEAVAHWRAGIDAR